MNQEVTLEMMLEAREKRAERQAQLLDCWRLPLVSFTMNIAGPVKNSPLIRRGFGIGRELLLSELSRIGAEIVERIETDEVTGCEAMYSVRFPAEELKNLTCELEEISPLGRLFDMDVIDTNGRKLERPMPRRCLICGNPACVCARNRTHSVEALQQATQALLRKAVQDVDAAVGAELAVRSLLFEVTTTPKPGLVDRENNGSHTDMDFYSFMSSTAALWPYFETCVRIGQETREKLPKATLVALRPVGKQAECRMLNATGNINTHKGVIFSLGLLCAALGRLGREYWHESERILGEIASMCEGIVEREMRVAGDKTAGGRIYVAYGLSGIRGEAEAGFPVVLKTGLPILEEGLRSGRSTDMAGTAALLHMLAVLSDTNMISRGSPERLKEIQSELKVLLQKMPWPDRKTLLELDRRFIADNLSPGGTADLLTLCYMLHFLKEDQVWITGYRT